MKREQFQITSSEGHDVIKSKWNSANREVEHLIGEIANEEGVTCRLVDSESVKEGFYHISGVRVWGTGETLHNTKEITFYINKIS